MAQNLIRIMLEMHWCIKINKWKKIILHPCGFEPLNPVVHWPTWEPDCLLLLQYCWDSIWRNCCIVIYSCLLSFWIVYLYENVGGGLFWVDNTFLWIIFLNWIWSKQIVTRRRFFLYFLSAHRLLFSITSRWKAVQYSLNLAIFRSHTYLLTMKNYCKIE